MKKYKCEPCDNDFSLDNEILQKRMDMSLPPLDKGVMDNILEFILISLQETETETPTKPITKPVETPEYNPAPDDDPWTVVRPLVIPGPKAFRIHK